VTRTGRRIGTGRIARVRAPRRARTTPRVGPPTRRSTVARVRRSRRRAAVFVDRDGTLNREVHYLASVAGLRLLPGVAAAIRRLGDAGFAIVLVTNQSGVARGRMTRDDAQQMMQTLLQYGAKQTDDFLADLERLLARGSALEERPAGGSGRRSRRRRSRRPAANLPIKGYDDLSAAQVQDRLDGLTPAELRKLRDYERRHANRKTVLDRIERKLR